ncbi:MAG: transglycosylase SLT domain-containing protein, partial [Acidobacteriota bacterium]
LPSLIIPHVHHKTKLLNLPFALLCVLLFSFPTLSQTPEERHKRLLTAVESGDLSAALTELNAIRASDLSGFEANNYDYLLGRIHEKRGDPASAAANYQSVAARNSVLSQYAVWHLAQLARSSGDLVQEREELRKIISSAPTSLLREAATMRLGQSFFDSQDYAGAIAALRPLGESKNRSVTRQALTFSGQALLKAGRQQEARESFTRLLMQMPDASRPDDFALAAVRGLDALDTGDSETATRVGQLPEAEHLLRASVYQFNRDFDAARLHYLAVVERYQQSPSVPNALYQIGRGYYQETRYDDALKYFEQVVQQYPASTSVRDALSFSAGSYNRLKRTDDAIAAYRLFIQRFPDAPNPERSYLNIIDALHEAGREKEALDWVGQTRTRFSNQIGDALALFAQTRIHLAQASWPAVVADTSELRKVSDLGGTRVAGGTVPSEVTFLRAYALEQLGRFDEAITDYLSIPFGRGEYYGNVATQRLVLLRTNPKARSLVLSRVNALKTAGEKSIAAGDVDQGRRAAQSAFRLAEEQAAIAEALKLVRRSYEALPAYKLPSFQLLPVGREVFTTAVPPLDTGKTGVLAPTHQAIAEELFYLGLYDEALPEFAASPRPTSNGLRASASLSDTEYTLAVFALRGGLANQAVRFGEQVWKTVPPDYVMQLAPHDLVDLLYPLPYREALLKHAAQRAVDPRFITAIARQESRFQPDAKSVSAARGLMQFIAATSHDVASQLGIRDFRQDDLYNPDSAVLFGFQYLATLFKQFPAQPQAVAAAYNGGPDNVARWIARSRSMDADRYVAEIGFSQSKDYVFKVMSNYWMYQQLYDEKLERR